MTSSNNSTSTIWEQIDLSESYLVSSMYEEAAYLSSSIIERIRDGEVAAEDADVINELAAMVLVQALNQLGRASEIFKELQTLFVSVVSIPVEALLTGTCFQISDGSLTTAQEVLDDFLSKWSYVDGNYVLLGSETQNAVQEKCNSRCFLDVGKYVEVAEVYTVTLLGKNSKNLNLAVSWVEKAALPEEKRQEMLRKLHSLYSLKVTNPLQESSTLTTHHETHNSLTKKPTEASAEAFKTYGLCNEESDKKPVGLKLSRHIEPTFWWFRSVQLRFKNRSFVITSWKMMLACFFLLAYYILRRKRASLTAIFKRQALLMKKSLVDLWQLAFSYQVNPLAAVQPLPAATRGGH